MRVIHVAPSVFGPDGLYGGGERYPLELARALAEVDCRPVSFGARPGRWRERGGLKVRVLRPLVRLHRHPAQPVTPLHVPELVGAEIVHTHFRSVPTLGDGGHGPRPGVGTVTDHGPPGRYGREIHVSELLGLTAREAMASGTRWSPAGSGAWPNWSWTGETGFLVEPGDLVVQRFTWRACAARCLTAYQAMHAASRGSARRRPGRR